MGVYDYKNLGTESSKALFADAMAIAMYSYHNLDNGFAAGYQHYGLGLGLPATVIQTLFGSTSSQGLIPGIPWNPDSEKAALIAVQKAGWTPISASALDYGGKVDARGTFFGEKPGYTTAQMEVLGKYDAAGKLLEIGIAFRGTSGPREILISDTIGDFINDALAALNYAKNYSGEAFGTLLGKIADFAKAQGLTGHNMVVSGHSLGGLAANSMADLSNDSWSGFYKDANYVTFASPTQSLGDKVLNIGYENDPVFRAIDGVSILPTLGLHDKPHEATTDNIVNFNDHYASILGKMLPFSVFSLPASVAHLPSAYGDGMTRILESKFYDLTTRDSTIIVANLSDPSRDNTWVQDLNLNAEPHKGSTFIIGSDGNDLIQGGRGNDYLEGRDGNDTFRDSGGYNIILGGSGYNTLDLQQSLKNVDVANDGAGTLYIRDGYGGITITRDIGALVSEESYLFFFNKDVTHSVTDKGLLTGKDLTAYASSVKGDTGDNVLKAHAGGDWLFGLDGNDHLIGGKGNDVFVGGAGNDLMESGGGENSFLFSGHFGQDQIIGYQSTDKLVFMGVDGVGEQYDYHAHAKEVGDDTVLTFGSDSVTLVGVGLNSLSADGIVIT
ncbi:polyurethane esterase [Pseudomonas sp.]|uniref:polyurethane esterase n=1 Tax=Pseudomonas sp. TaxID=306 RepID=UPI003D6F62FE